MGDKKRSQPKSSGGKQPPESNAVAVSKPAPPATESKSGGGGAIAALAFITALGAAGLGYKGWEESNKLNNKLADQNEQIESSITTALKPAIESVDSVQSDIGSLQSTLASLQDEIASLQSEIGVLKGGVETLETSQQSGLGEVTATLDKQIKDVQSLHGSLEEQQKSIQDNVAALNEGLTTLKSEIQAEAEKDKMAAWVLAEVEYLLHIANSRLNLEHDVDSALTALNAAAKQLGELNLTDIEEIKQMIQGEIEALGGVPKLNIPKMAQTLATIGSDVETLPLAKPKEAKLTSGANDGDGRKKWEVLADEVWGALKPLVTVRNSRDPAMAPLTPEKHLYLTQNLQLKIESARLALLRGDNSTYQENLNIANEWVSQFYDTEAAESAAVLSTLGELKQAKIDGELPDISGSLKALQQYIASNALKVSAPNNSSSANNMLVLSSSSTNSVVTDANIH